MCECQASLSCQSQNLVPDKGCLENKLLNDEKLSQLLRVSEGGLEAQTEHSYGAGKWPGTVL